MSDDGEDHFSTTARAYSRYRPSYPEALFKIIDTALYARRRAWDCATGNGQALRPLLSRFEEVVASDVSVAQLACVERRPGVQVVAARAQAMPLPPAVIDLVTVAQALHWFAHTDFYDEVRRVLRPGGVLAAWTYGLCRVSLPVDAVLGRFYGTTLQAYWPADREHVETAYASLPWPFLRQRTHALTMTAQWSLDHFCAYLGTWSAVQRYRRAQGGDPMAAVRDELRAAWGQAPRRQVEWPLTLKIAWLD